MAGVAGDVGGPCRQHEDRIVAIRIRRAGRHQRHRPAIGRAVEVGGRIPVGGIEAGGRLEDRGAAVGREGDRLVAAEAARPDAAFGASRDQHVGAIGETLVDVVGRVDVLGRDRRVRGEEDGAAVSRGIAEFRQIDAVPLSLPVSRQNRQPVADPLVEVVAAFVLGHQVVPGREEDVAPVARQAVVPGHVAVGLGKAGGRGGARRDHPRPALEPFVDIGTAIGVLRHERREERVQEDPLAVGGGALEEGRQRHRAEVRFRLRVERTGREQRRLAAEDVVEVGAAAVAILGRERQGRAHEDVPGVCREPDQVGVGALGHPLGVRDECPGDATEPLVDLADFRPLGEHLAKGEDGARAVFGDAAAEGGLAFGSVALDRPRLSRQQQRHQRRRH